VRDGLARLGERAPPLHTAGPHTGPPLWQLPTASRYGRRGSYSAAEVDDWASRLRRERPTDAFVHFNNDWEAFAPRNLLRLRRRLGTICRSAT
jgi:uncharacterized protein YecE (DUF72 family)